MNIDLDDAELFVRVSELGSLSAAARERHVLVSQVSRALARLEARCGARLMHRNTHGLSLTDEGDTFVAHARRLVDTRNELAAEFSRHRGGPAGQVRLGVSPVLAETVIGPSLPSLYERYPQLRLEVMADDRISDMARDGIDIAVRTGATQNDQLIAMPLAEHGRRLCASPAYLARHGTPQHPDDLAHHRLISHSVSAGLNRWPYAPGKAPSPGAVFVAQGHTRSDNSAVTMALAVQGVGIARVNDLLSRAHIASGALVPVLDDWFDRSRVPIYAVMLPERHRLPKLRACIDHWREWLGQAHTAT
ncbi:MAG: LysR family transcriptional regulator [Hydrogenophaga sp.]|uniref:LysR family transcriptional regulator n=1 Tax=Hydrogenophaga sp. TaxID=1904254 RepID=UPI001D675D15|nr:LysR family transcriptional regulator [Hydrogenophaga sp.]MBX3611607.1 LysR family transcriptional regulator [Hydrogenophaga sp.]